MNKTNDKKNKYLHNEKKMGRMKLRRKIKMNRKLLIRKEEIITKKQHTLTHNNT